jgi:multidrug transporter EmrE-like cation transporter
MRGAAAGLVRAVEERPPSPDKSSTMHPHVTALLLLLVAAGAHASWNLVAKTATGGSVFVWLATAASGMILLPVGLVAFAVSAQSVEFGLAFALMAGSAALKSGYFLSLQRAYRDGELSFVYPIARGTGALGAAVAAILVFDERPSLIALAGAAVIVAAIMALPGRSLFLERTTSFVFLTGLFVAGYTLWDKQAVDTYAMSPLVYISGETLLRILFVAAIAQPTSGAIRQTWSFQRWKVVAVGVLSASAYLLVLYALVLAPVTYVAPARELGVLLAAALGVQLLSESQRRRRLLCAGAVVVGLSALAIG